jgi:hypothetical protein
MFARIMQAFRPLDLTEADAAIDAAARSQKDVAVRARALRMDVSCGDPAAVMERFAARIMGSAGHMLRTAYDDTTYDALPPQLACLVRKLD